MDELTPEQQVRVDQIRRALEQELRDSSQTAIHASAIKDLEEIKTDALEAIKHTVKFSQNESLKTKVAMWAYDRLIQEGKTTADPLADILAGMEAASRKKAEAE